MELLDFARGPALTAALAIFVLGTLWRLAGVLLLPRLRDLSPPREGAPPALLGGLRTVLRRMWPRPEFAQATLFMTVNSYVFHLGLALVVFGLAPHILFIRKLSGLHWPSLPSNLVYAVGVVTLASLLAVLARTFTRRGYSVQCATSQQQALQQAQQRYCWLCCGCEFEHPCSKKYRLHIKE